MKRMMIAAALVALAVPAWGQAPPQNRERVLASRLFMMQIFRNCPDVGVNNLDALTSRTRASLAQQSPGPRGDGIAAGVEASMLITLAGMLFYGDRPAFCLGMTPLFTSTLAEMASE